MGACTGALLSASLPRPTRAYPKSLGGLPGVEQEPSHKNPMAGESLEESIGASDPATRSEGSGAAGSSELEASTL